MNKQYLHQQLFLWYEQNHRTLPWRETTDPYHIWLSEIILQQTRVTQGIDYYFRLCSRFPRVEELAQASEEEVMRYWQGLGYYSRARNLHAAAKQIVEQFGGIFPNRFEDIRSLKGVGDYTAGAISSFAFNLPYPALDGNVYRVLSRLMDISEAFDTTKGKRLFHQVAVDLMSTTSPRLYNSAIMEFGALYCIPQNPDCEACPLSTICLAHHHHTVDLLPVRKPRTALRDRFLTYIVYEDNAHATLLHQRKENDIWKHLFEPILIEDDHLLDAKEIAAHFPRYASVRLFFETKHTLSHQQLYARFYHIQCSSLPTIADTIIIPLDSLDQYALSRLSLKAF